MGRREPSCPSPPRAARRAQQQARTIAQIPKHERFQQQHHHVLHQRQLPFPGPPHHHLHNQSRRSSTGGTGSGSPGSAASPTQACAACKYQRRKCNPDCTLAPYFPADHHRQFINAHRLFGVSNILKTLRGLDHPQRTWAMKNITFQSNMRSQDAVGGCYRIIFDIQRQIEVGLADQEQLVRYLALCRAQAQARVNSQSFLPDANVIGNPIADDHQLHQQQPFLYYCAGGGEASGSVVKTHEGGVDPPPVFVPLRLCGIDLGQDLQRPENDEGHHERLPLDMFELRNHQPTTFPAAIEEEDVQKGVSTLDFSMARLEMAEDNNNMSGQVQEHELKSAASLLKLTNCDLSGR